MGTLRSGVARVLGNKENVIHALLLGTFVVLGFRSEEQQRQIEALEAERSSLRAANSAMSAAMWSWRETLFRLADSPPPHPISLSRLRAIYGEDEPPIPRAADDRTGSGGDDEEESISIS
ncbi:uncharacterized protein LOC109718019 [Ananas comosus]|uniref:Uncharacterized protein LOC109718019 n=1 Tax=Ananas comosus TaxID=4615 RepID=A0A199W7N8_ANACO|nr:uncharacterized protein LOC109718019 [Ananas comosus]OAY85472.1 hypothetical protein ACMD2_04090 [Ananas comosus]